VYFVGNGICELFDTDAYSE